MTETDVKKAIDEIEHQVHKNTDNFEMIISKDTYETMMCCMNKQTARIPAYEGDGYADGYPVYDTWICPNCETHYEVDYHDYKYCPNCGQHINLKEVF